MNIWSARIAGIAGVLSALAMIPAYVVGTPDRPGSDVDITRYYADSTAFIAANGILPLLHTFLFLFFLGGLVSLLRDAGDRYAPGVHTALAGGITFIVLTSAGFAAEVVAPAMVLRFGADAPNQEIAMASLTLAVWLYHYCQVGAAVMITATSLVAAQSGVLPRWAVLLGAVAAVLTLLHTWIPLVAALAGLAWIVLISLLLIMSTDRRPARAV